MREPPLSTLSGWGRHSAQGRERVGEDLERISADVNNIFNNVGFTEGEEGSAAPGDFVRIRPINGRTASISLSYQF